jgi:hypothetical protein
MKLTVPPLEIADDEGFSPEKDIFKRKEFGERLSSLIENTDGNLVIALDAPWGEGKSTFVRMWRGHLKNKNNGIHTIYFDAFENDHQNMPFLALAGEIYNLIDEDNGDEKKKFKAKTIGALKTAGRITLRTGIKALTAGILDDTIFENNTKEDISKEVSTEIDTFITNQLKAASVDKKNIKDFKKYLEGLPAKLSYNGKSIIFIIDELDRCKPPFALEIVEIVKHLFAVPNITFVLVTNKTQLEASVKKEYGTPDAAKYMQKFINLWVSLPKAKEGYDHDSRTYLSRCIKLMEMEPTNQNQQDWMAMFEELIIYYSVSFREIERCMTNFAFLRANLNSNLNHHYQWITAYLAIIKVIYPTVYSQLCVSQIDYPTLVKNTSLDKLQRNWMLSEQPSESHYLKWLLRYYLSDDEQAKALLLEGNHLGPVIWSNGRTAIRDVCKWLDSFRMN